VRRSAAVASGLSSSCPCPTILGHQRETLTNPTTTNQSVVSSSSASSAVALLAPDVERGIE
jgi:hypothetical protein